MEKNTKKAKKNSEKSLKNLKPWKKGEPSPNPNGRPLGLLNRQTLFDKWAFVQQDTQNPFTGKIESLSQDDIAVLSLLKEVRAGNVKAIQEWLDNRFGKLKEQMEHSGNITNIELTLEQKEAIIKKYLGNND